MSQEEQEKNEENKNKENDDEKLNDDKPKSDFSGTWILKTNGPSTDDYYKSEGWSWFMRKAVPTMNLTQVITQNGSKFKIQMIVNVMGKEVANQTNESVIGSGEEIEYKDKDGYCVGVSRWNDDKTEMLTDIVRKDDKKRTYKGVRKFADATKKKMICTTTNHLGKVLVQTYELKQ